MRRVFCIGMAAFAAPWLAAPASAEPSPGQASPQTGEIVVTAPLEGALIDSLQGSAVIGREELTETLQGGLGDTLDRVPGVASTFYGAGASRPIIRGLGEDRVRILENGIGAIDASAASPDHAVTADGLDASRIEVLRGAAALAYGGNAIGGVVNVLDESIPTRAVSGLEGSTLLGYSFGNQQREGALSLGAGAGDVAFHLSAASRQAEDYDTPEGEPPNSYADYQAASAGASYVRDWGFLGFAVKRTESQYGLPPEDPAEPGGHIELEQTRYEMRGDARVNWGAFNRVDFAVQSADYQHTEFEGDGAAGTLFSNQGYEARGEVHHGGLDDRLSGAIGAQIIDSDFEAIGEEAFITLTETRDLGLFAVERLDFGFWGLEGGARFETRELDNRGAGGRDFDATSFSLGAFMRPAENWFLAATMARTERAPTGVELFANGPHLATLAYERGDPALGVETASSIEASLRYTTDALSLELNLYRVEFDDYIALLDTGLTRGDLGLPADPELDDLPVFDFTARDATFTGGEFSARARLFALGDFTISADGALDLVRASFDGGGRPPRIPPRSLTLGVSAESEALDLRLEAVDIADQNRTAAFETETPGYTLWNLRAVARPFGDNLRFIVDARNLTDELARAHTSFLKDELPLPGRSLRFALAADF